MTLWIPVIAAVGESMYLLRRALHISAASSSVIYIMQLTLTSVLWFNNYHVLKTERDFKRIVNQKFPAAHQSTIATVKSNLEIQVQFIRNVK